RLTICSAVMPLKPTAAHISSSEAKLNLSHTREIFSCIYTSFNVNSWCLISFSINSRPFTIFSCRNCFLKNCLILFFAWEECAIFTNIGLVQMNFSTSKFQQYLLYGAVYLMAPCCRLLLHQLFDFPPQNVLDKQSLLEQTLMVIQ